MGKIDELTEQAKEHLDAGEEIVAVVKGFYEVTLSGTQVGTYRSYLMGRNSVGEGVWIATDKKIAFYRTKMFSGYQFEFYSYSRISSIEVDTKWTGHRIAFFATNGNQMCMTQINEGEVQKFIEHVKSKVEKTEQEITHSESIEDIPDQIRKLAELKDYGILTEDEFESKKKELLARL